MNLNAPNAPESTDSNPSGPAKLINQGSYGCIYHPSLSCKGNKTTNQYITKVQRYVANSKKENRISKIVKKIKNYKQYFGPIESSCFLSVSKLQNDEIKKCEFMAEDPSDKYISNRIRYVGKETLGEYLLKQLKMSPIKMIRNVFSGYSTLLKALLLLEKKKIVHLDLKENNILIDNVTQSPIIIDFGLSFRYNDVNDNDNMEKQREVFFTYGCDYIVWCIDVAMITYINAIETLQETVTVEQIQTVIIDFITKNTITVYYSDDEKKNYQTRLEQYYGQWVGKTWTEMVSAIKIASIDTWDNYSIAAIFYEIIEMTTIKEPAIEKFLVYLKNNILLATPDQRFNVRESIREMNQLLKSIHKSDFNGIRMLKWATNQKYKDSLDIKYSKNKLAGLKKENEINSVILLKSKL